MMDFFTAEELVENYEKFRKLINQTFEGERLEALNKMYDHFEERMIYTPASSVEHYHNAFPGGYVDHVLRVTRNALKIYEQQKEWGLDMGDLDKETIIFTALHHDLGKLGVKNSLHYISNDSEWHIKNRGDNYKRNEDNAFMSITDRTFFTLQDYGIKYTENEYFGIKLTDGIFDDDNVKYYKTYDKSKYLKTNIQFILHWADWMSTTIERDQEIKAPF